MAGRSLGGAKVKKMGGGGTQYSVAGAAQYTDTGIVEGVSARVPFLSLSLSLPQAYYYVPKPHSLTGIAPKRKNRFTTPRFTPRFTPRMPRWPKSPKTPKTPPAQQGVPPIPEPQFPGTPIIDQPQGLEAWRVEFSVCSPSTIAAAGCLPPTREASLCA